MSALEVRLTEGEQARLRYRGPVNLEASVKRAKALAHFRLMNREGNALAKQEVEEAIVLVPENSSLYSMLTATHIMDLWLGSTKSNLISFAQATTSVKKAIALDKDNSDAYLVLGQLHLLKREHDEAIAAAERAVALNPNGADAYANLGMILVLAGRPEEGLEFVKKAIRLNPIPPAYYFQYLGLAYRGSGQYEEAISAHKKAIYKQPTFLFAHLGLAASYVYLGREEEAHTEAAEVLKIDPGFSLVLSGIESEELAMVRQKPWSLPIASEDRRVQLEQSLDLVERPYFGHRLRIRNLLLFSPERRSCLTDE